jgi:hypothetical protein
MPLSWSEIRDRAVAFSREYRDAQSEKSLSQQFWRDFFNVFGVDAKRVASYELCQRLTSLLPTEKAKKPHKTRKKGLNQAHGAEPRS